MKSDFKHGHKQHRERMLAMAREMFQVEDTTGIELFGTLHRVAHTSELLETQLSEGQDLSGPRWSLMVRLFGEEYMGNRDGLTPTVLSRSQRVSKNTISALLRGLEEQGLIQRNLDPNDLRVFRIQLTDAGRELIRTTAPRRMEGLNQLLRGISTEEVHQLITLLDKLHQALMVRVDEPCQPEVKNS